MGWLFSLENPAFSLLSIGAWGESQTNNLRGRLASKDGSLGDPQRQRTPSGEGAARTPGSQVAERGRAPSASRAARTVGGEARAPREVGGLAAPLPGRGRGRSRGPSRAGKVAPSQEVPGCGQRRENRGPGGPGPLTSPRRSCAERLPRARRSLPPARRAARAGAPRAGSALLAGHPVRPPGA